MVKIKVVDMYKMFKSSNMYNITSFAASSISSKVLSIKLWNHIPTKCIYSEIYKTFFLNGNKCMKQ